MPAFQVTEKLALKTQQKRWKRLTAMAPMPISRSNSPAEKYPVCSKKTTVFLAPEPRFRALYAIFPLSAMGWLWPVMDLTRSAADAPSSESPYPTSRTILSFNG